MEAILEKLVQDTLATESAGRVQSTVLNIIANVPEITKDETLLAFKKTVLALIATHTNHTRFFETVSAVLDAALRLTQDTAGTEAMVDEALCLLLIEDLSESLTIRENEKLFDYIESRVEQLTANMDPAKGKGLVLLRFCNDLLRRLSKTRHTVFSGRILLFLTGVYPLTERSGVNLRGDFNVDNVTSFDTIPGDENKFYHTFWSLQAYFSNPITVLKNSAEWIAMEHAIESVLRVFEAENDTDLKSSSSGASHSLDISKKRKAEEVPSPVYNQITGDGALEGDDEYFSPKFLTSRNLFELQIKDISFRRQIMVQMLIIFQFFMGLSKQALETTALTTTNKSLSFLAYNLTDSQESWVNQTRSRVVKIVEQTHPNGRRFLTTLATVITHESNWIKWKAESCPSFEKYLTEGLELRKKFMEHSRATAPSFSGSHQLDSLKMKETDPEKLLTDSTKHSQIVKPLVEFLEPLAEQLNDDGTVAEGVEEEYLYSRDKAFNWRAYRIALNTHFHLFKDVENINTQKMVKRLKETLRDDVQEDVEAAGMQAVEENTKGEDRRDEGAKKNEPDAIHSTMNPGIQDTEMAIADE